MVLSGFIKFEVHLRLVARSQGSLGIYLGQREIIARKNSEAFRASQFHVIQD